MFIFLLIGQILQASPAQPGADSHRGRHQPDCICRCPRWHHTAHVQRAAPVASMATGGSLPPKSGNPDGSIPINAHEGEYVIPSHVVRAKGTEFFDKLVQSYTGLNKPANMGESRVAMGIWNTIKNAAQSVGHFVKKNWKVIVGVAAAVAIPFVAPAIGGLLAASPFLASVAPGVASFLGGSLGSGLIGAGLGAGAAAVTGQSPLLGAAVGGLGGFGGSLFGAGGMLGAPTGAAAAAPAAGGLVDIGAATSLNAATGATTAASGAVAASPAALGNIASALAANPKSVGALAQLAMVMFNKDMNSLTKEEKVVWPMLRSRLPLTARCSSVRSRKPARSCRWARPTRSRLTPMPGCPPTPR